MKENFAYSEWTCDRCGRTEKTQTDRLPKNWNIINLNYCNYDMCPECSGKILQFVNNHPNK